MLKNWRTQQSCKRLNKLTPPKRTARRVLALEEAVRILLLVDATNLARFEQVMRYAQELKQQHKHVLVCALTHDKKPAESLLLRQDLILIGPEGIDWFYRPKSYPGEVAWNFQADYLIDCSDRQCLTLLWVVKRSKAQLKVSFLPDEHGVFDISILLPNSSWHDQTVELAKQLKALSGPSEPGTKTPANPGLL